MNTITLAGRVGQIKVNAAKTAATVSIATSDWNGKEEVTNWHTIVLRGKIVNVLNHVDVGDQLIVAGSLFYRAFEHEGQKRTAAEIVAQRVTFGAKKKLQNQEVATKAAKAPAAETVETDPF